MSVFTTLILTEAQAFLRDYAIGEITALTGIAAGTAGWFRFRGNAPDTGLISTTLARLDGSCATSGADLLIPNIVIVVGSSNTINEFSPRFPLQ